MQSGRFGLLAAHSGHRSLEVHPHRLKDMTIRIFEAAAAPDVVPDDIFAQAREGQGGHDRISVRHGRLRRRFRPRRCFPRRADPGGCALTVAATPMSLASVVYGGRRVADAEAEGELTLTGDRQLFDRFVTWFPLPEKIG